MNASGVITWGAETGLVVSLLVIAILLIRKPFSRLFGAGPTYALWGLPLIRLCLPIFVIPQSWVPDWLYNPNGAEPLTQATSLAVTIENAVNINAISTGPVSPIGNPLNFNGFELNWTAIIIGLWVAVAVFWIVAQLLRQRNFVKTLRENSQIVDTGLSDEITRASDIIGLKRLPDIRLSSENLGPFVTGFTRPMVILPNHFETEYCADQRQYALIHEFAHIKRRDLWVALAALIFRGLNWFNPLVHYGVNKMRVDQEAACDDFVLRKMGASQGERFTYAKTLIHAAKLGGANTNSAQLALSLMGERVGEGDKKGDENA